MVVVKWGPITNLLLDIREAESWNLRLFYSVDLVQDFVNEGIEGITHFSMALQSVFRLSRYLDGRIIRHRLGI